MTSPRRYYFIATGEREAAEAASTRIAVLRRSGYRTNYSARFPVGPLFFPPYRLKFFPGTDGFLHILRCSVASKDDG